MHSFATVPALQNIAVEDVVRAGFDSLPFRTLVLSLGNEVHVLGDTEEKLSSTDPETMQIELSSLLNELNCPYDCLTSGKLSSRYDNEKNALVLLNYLVAELMSLQMYHSNKAAKGTMNVIQLQETPTATALKVMSTALVMGAPPANLTTTDLFRRLNMRVDEVLKKAGRNRIGKPLLCPKNSWTEKQWMDLEKRHAELDKEYDLRREMLLTRLDCTVQAFNWSERMKHQHNAILETYRKKLVVLEKLVKGGSSTDIVALLAARDLLLAIEKASSAAVVKNTKSKIQRHIIGSVPDRGGRAWEHAPPPPEMPSWQKQRATGGGGGGGGRGGGFRGRGDNHHRGGSRGRGGGHGGGFQGQQQQHQQQNYQSYNSNDQYDNNRGGGRRVQSGWSQRGAPGGGGGNNNFDQGRGGYSNDQRGGGGGGRRNNNNYRGGPGRY